MDMVKVSNDNTMTNFIIQERVKRFLTEGKFEEAEKYYLKSLKFKEQAYGKDDPSVLPLLQEIKAYYEHINEDEKAEEFRIRCEEIKGQSLSDNKEIKIEKDFHKIQKKAEQKSEIKQSKEVFIYKKVEEEDVQEESDSNISNENQMNQEVLPKNESFPKAYYFGQIARVLDFNGDVSDQVSGWAKFPGKMILDLGSLKPPVNTPHDRLLIQIMSTVSPFEPSDLNVESEKDSDAQVAFWMGYYSKEAVIL